MARTGSRAGRFRWRGRLTAGLLFVLLGACPGVAWSAPVRIDGNEALYGLSCPSTGQCTGVDIEGQEVTFNPTATTPASSTPSKVFGTQLNDVACPSAGQCTAIGNSGQEVTFNPASPGSATSATVDGEKVLLSVACASTTQCTAVTYNGEEVTFNPASPGAPTPVVVDGTGGPGLNGEFGVACPSASQCTAVEEHGREATFGPSAPGAPTPATIDAGHALHSVACPSESQCTAIDDYGQEVTFNPTVAGGATPSTIDADEVLRSVACASTSQCTAVGIGAEEVTFDPTAPASLTLARLEPDGVSINAGELDAIACPSASQCTAVNREGEEVTFNPASPDAAIPVSGPSTPSVSAAQVGASLEAQLTPSGKGVRIAALVKGGAIAVAFDALEGGTAVIDWYEAPPGARLSKKDKSRPVLVASGQLSFAGAATARIRIRLTAAGKRLLEHARQLMVTALGTFTPSGGPPVSAEKRFVLRR